MELEKQVCSLELAKRLKELGVKQESYFVIRTDGYGVWHPKEGDYQYDLQISYSAFTVAELGEMLPLSVTSSREQNLELDIVPWWCVEYDGILNEQREGFRNRCFTDDTEADARARMLQYLLENGIISAYEINKKMGSN